MIMGGFLFQSNLKEKCLLLQASQMMKKLGLLQKIIKKRWPKWLLHLKKIKKKKKNSAFASSVLILLFKMSQFRWELNFCLSMAEKSQAFEDSYMNAIFVGRNIEFMTKKFVFVTVVATILFPR